MNMNEDDKLPLAWAVVTMLAFLVVVALGFGVLFLGVYLIYCGMWNVMHDGPMWKILVETILGFGILFGNSKRGR